MIFEGGFAKHAISFICTQFELILDHTGGSCSRSICLFKEENVNDDPSNL